MTPKRFFRKPVVLIGLATIAVVSCMKMSPTGTSSKTNSSALIIREDAATGKARAKEIREKTAVKV
ncbi:hypothetical protein, partial [Dyadobacter sp. CY312]